MRVEAKAKLNLILNVLGKREDGYHEIETVFYALDLCDYASLEPMDDDEDLLIMFDKEGEFIELEQKENIAYKALCLMREEFDNHDCFDIRIEKLIPMAGGLGGGSADAAAVVYMLSKLWNIDDEERLYNLCSKLGSDVSFCLATQFGHKAAIGRGRGEELLCIDLPEFTFDIKESDIDILNKTASVYAELTEEDCKHKFDIEGMLREKDAHEMAKYFGNQLQAPLERITGIVEDEYVLCGAGPSYFKCLD